MGEVGREKQSQNMRYFSYYVTHLKYFYNSEKIKVKIAKFHLLIRL